MPHGFDYLDLARGFVFLGGARGGTLAQGAAIETVPFSTPALRQRPVLGARFAHDRQPRIAASDTREEDLIRLAGGVW